MTTPERGAARSAALRCLGAPRCAPRSRRARRRGSFQRRPTHNQFNARATALALRPELARDEADECDRSIPDARHSVEPIGLPDTAIMFGTRVAEPILASGHVCRTNRPDI